MQSPPRINLKNSRVNLSQTQTVKEAYDTNPRNSINDYEDKVSCYKRNFIPGSKITEEALNYKSSKDIKNEGRLKEYAYPPLPNIPGVSKAYLK
jgi:hypothetical protein